ncbi:PPOX class F420-dependent oxidoreductase [Actinokineospora bangkokensis]|uniref:PPOX class F420-dependent enzyme n=1 Tax=Actinokineospora bangkokensis TaxID=1193682 RepID=A0A1Q9LQE0_9PSEU|nr:PPOX class F420-dependent oxidoreductase [Actinokineospora bangkokensis]OLR94240.1 PPOX class F420-dependent enzyme [Actinokineospora bangkokensis]
MADALTPLADSKYLLVRTFRRTGKPVDTPVWHVREGDHLLFWTVSDSGKVKRIRNNPEVEVAPCTLRGTPTGPFRKATATLLPAAETATVRRKISKRYGLMGWLTTTGSKLRRGDKGTVGVSVSLT